MQSRRLFHYGQLMQVADLLESLGARGRRMSSAPGMGRDILDTGLCRALF
jgi:hypothetical protein